MPYKIDPDVLHKVAKEVVGLPWNAVSSSRVPPSCSPTHILT
jgi:hypothetical protein